jgi:hypothetical protein
MIKTPKAEIFRWTYFMEVGDKVKKFIGITLLIFIFLVSGCSSNEAENVEQPAKVKETKINGIMNEGVSIPIQYIQHIEGNEYELGIVNPSTHRLKWLNSRYDLAESEFVYSGVDFSVVVEKDVEHNYLERKENNENTAVFVLHINENNSMDAGVITRSCGKSCTESIQTEMISK